MKTIMLITHAITNPGNGATGWNPDPGMTEEGLRRMTHLREEVAKRLPLGKPTEIYCGTGRRQWQMLEPLGLSAGRVFYSDLWGGAATIVVIDGEKHVLLGHGQVVSWDQYRSSNDLAETMMAKIRDLADGAVILSGRPVLRRLGIKPEEAQNGALYEIIGHDDGRLEVRLAVSGVNLMATAQKT